MCEISYIFHKSSSFKAIYWMLDFQRKLKLKMYNIISHYEIVKW
jgi:hypothetical protein